VRTRTSPQRSLPLLPVLEARYASTSVTLRQNAAERMLLCVCVRFGLIGNSAGIFPALGEIDVGRLLLRCMVACLHLIEVVSW